jgi:hypothetical protein
VTTERHNDTSLTAAIALAHATSPGQGIVQRSLNLRWCAKCDGMRPTKGGSRNGWLFICAMHKKAGA